MKELITSTEIQKLYGVTRPTILSWKRKGYISPVISYPGGRKCIWDHAQIRKVLGLSEIKDN